MGRRGADRLVGVEGGSPPQGSQVVGGPGSGGASSWGGSLGRMDRSAREGERERERERGARQWRLSKRLRLQLQRPY